MNTAHLISRTRQALTDKGAKPESIKSLLSPYRINPIGAHVDHQGGDVLAQTINQYTIISFCAEPETSKAEGHRPAIQPEKPAVSLQSLYKRQIDSQRFEVGAVDSQINWVRYAAAAAAALHAVTPLTRHVHAAVDGTLVSAGLSSSASVVLAYLSAFAHCNDQQPQAPELVELSRQVENDYMGLNNGIQDQMSIIYGKQHALSHLHILDATATDLPTPRSHEVGWVILYSGYSRELINSGFNTRVQECREAAALLQPGASILSAVAFERREASEIKKIDSVLAKRAQHFFTETARVEAGASAWRAGLWSHFGELMNQSCHSSITQYESGSDALIAAHEIASSTTGVLGSRFGGGGYGGCLMMLCDRAKRDDIAGEVLERYLSRYPDRQNIAHSFSAEAVDGLQPLPLT